MGELREVDAGAFAVVMATGIIGVGARLEGLELLADALLAVACAVWLLLVAALRSRVTGSPAVVAGTVVIGADFGLAGLVDLALALWSLAAALLVAVTFARDRADDNPLLWVVAIESLAVLGAALDRHHEAPLEELAVAFWALGLALYPFVAGRVIGVFFRQREFHPDLWIVMGALAIATLAAGELLLDRHALGAGAALTTWAAGSALVPLLAATELRFKRWGYERARWSFVFPLGMYGVASHVLGSADGLVVLQDIGTVSFGLALAAWTLTAVGLLRTLHLTLPRKV